MSSCDFTQLDRLIAYAEQRFDLPRLAGCFSDSRVDPKVPARATGLTLLLGELSTVPATCNWPRKPNCRSGKGG